MVYQLIYTSAAKQSLDGCALRKIAQTSISNNQKLDITGLLLFHNQSVLQVLEGDQISVESLYEKITQDPLHTGCMVLSTRATEFREFPEWSMGFKNIAHCSEENALFNLNKTSLARVMPNSPSQELSTLAQTYARVSGL